MAAFDNCYCDDESLAIEAAADLPDLLPRNQRLAEARDGAFANTSWVLTSASNLFATQQVEPGHVVILSRIEGRNYRETILGVASVLDAGLTTRMIGLAAGFGLAPGVGGALTEVEFKIITAEPQILAISDDMRANFFVAAGSVAEDILRGQLKEAAVCGTLADLYFAKARNVADQSADWASKAAFYREQYVALVLKLKVSTEIIIETPIEEEAQATALNRGPAIGELTADPTYAFPYDSWDRRRSWPCYRPTCY